MPRPARIQSYHHKPQWLPRLPDKSLTHFLFKSLGSPPPEMKHYLPRVFGFPSGQSGTVSRISASCRNDGTAWALASSRPSQSLSQWIANAQASHSVVVRPFKPCNSPSRSPARPLWRSLALGNNGRRFEFDIFGQAVLKVFFRALPLAFLLGIRGHPDWVHSIERACHSLRG